MLVNWQSTPKVVPVHLNCGVRATVRSSNHPAGFFLPLYDGSRVFVALRSCAAEMRLPQDSFDQTRLETKSGD